MMDCWGRNTASEREKGDDNDNDNGRDLTSHPAVGSQAPSTHSDDGLSMMAAAWIAPAHWPDLRCEDGMGHCEWGYAGGGITVTGLPGLSGKLSIASRTPGKTRAPKYRSLMGLDLSGKLRPFQISHDTGTQSIRNFNNWGVTCQTIPVCDNPSVLKLLQKKPR